MIFPGMDPYLEKPNLWLGLHTSLIVYFRNQLQPLLRPRYIASIEERVFLEGAARERVPDVWIKRRRKPRTLAASKLLVIDADNPVVVKDPIVEVHQRYLAILDNENEQAIVTVIELVSPSNKYEGSGRDSYLAKREIRESTTHLVEIDLLRTGHHVLAVSESLAREHGPYDYLACVNRAVGERDEFDLYPRTLRERLPRIRVPLSGRDHDVVLDVQAALEQAYEDACYDDRIDYTKPCRPRLSPEDQAWANQLIRKALRGKRTATNGKSRPR
jgi:hypothetical protein